MSFSFERVKQRVKNRQKEDLIWGKCIKQIIIQKLGEIELLTGKKKTGYLTNNSAGYSDNSWLSFLEKTITTEAEKSTINVEIINNISITRHE